MISFGLQKQGREHEAQAIFRKLHPPEQADAELQALKESVENEAHDPSTKKIGILRLLRSKTIRRGLTAGVGLQVFQQFVGINTVMYYSPTIVQFAGFASNQTALLLSLVTVGLNAFGSVVSIYFINRSGWKKLLVFSLYGDSVALGFLSAVFHEATSHAPGVSVVETLHFGGWYQCPDYRSAGPSPSWDCVKCLRASSPSCGFLYRASTEHASYQTKP